MSKSLLKFDSTSDADKSKNIINVSERPVFWDGYFSSLFFRLPNIRRVLTSIFGDNSKIYRKIPTSGYVD